MAGLHQAFAAPSTASFGGSNASNEITEVATSHVDRGRKAAPEFDYHPNMVLVPYLLRVQVGHSYSFMDPFRCRKKVEPEDLKLFSVFVHRARKRCLR